MKRCGKRQFPPFALKSFSSALSIRSAVFLVAALLLLVSSAVWAGPTTTEQAGSVTLNWLSLEAQPMGSYMGQQVREVRTYVDDAGEPVYYVAFLDPAGLVFLPADDLVEPIIGFVSDATSYDPSQDRALEALVSRDIPGRVKAARAAEAQIPEGMTAAPGSSLTAAQQKWFRLQSASPRLQAPGAGLSSISDVRVDRLVQSKWDQTTVNGQACYNYYTPPNVAGNSGNYPSGCTATAMAQLMRYHQYPVSPVVSTFGITVGGSPQPATIRGGDGSGGAYNWTDMIYDPLNSSPTLAQRQAIGALMYDAGLSVSMQYDAEASGAWPFGYALRNTFRYSNAIFAFNNELNIDGASRNAMINPNLNAQYPVIIAINGNDGGHSVVCDGYGYNSSTLYHHLNMGWSGTSDAWYNLPDISASGYTFNSVYGCTYNIFTTGTGEIISGRVTDSGGNSIAGVTVTATHGTDTYNAVSTTTGKGLYAIPHVPSNTTFTVTASKTGYAFSSQSTTTGTSTDNTTASGSNAVTGNKDNVDFVGSISDSTAPSLSITSHTDNQHVSSSSITLSGTASDSGKGDSGIQQVTVNASRASNDTATGSATASWSTSVTLNYGSNTITVIAYDNSTNHNNTSQTITIYRDDTTAPTLSITSHANNDHVSAPSITLSGAATDSGKGDSGIQQVTVNASRASNDTATGSATASWSTSVTLTLGSNTITVIAYDNSTSHNSTTQTLTVVRDASSAVPTVDTPTIGTIGTTTATLGANISSNGGATVTASGIAYGTSANPTTSTSTATNPTVTSGTFTVNLTGLTSNTLYHFRGFATNSAGTGYTTDSTFTTVANAPTASAATGVSFTGFTANWVAPSGTAAITGYRLDVSTDPGFSSFVTGYNDLSLTGTSRAVTGLSAGTYYYRVRAVNAGGTSTNSSTVSVAATTSAGNKLWPSLHLLLGD